MGFTAELQICKDSLRAIAVSFGTKAYDLITAGKPAKTENLHKVSILS